MRHINENSNLKVSFDLKKISKTIELNVLETYF